ncbi:hypothetical protein MSG28_015587 [Choristoneura fumiferana]|uniref:Uncharacterized protein n=1 Tax=Choristoneura fumiferana TaxID=7141 RepID=A0ACC0KAQ5_CHOFU|nr:hypothetical protein MSG28_015587 [Choristoneura fumiferana]
MAEAAFSEDGKYYSAISQDGRLRIWDTETNTLKQEYTPDLHLTSPPSCVQWITVGTSAVTPQKGKRRSSVSAQETQCIALGTTSGKILIYSVAKAKVETVLEEKLGPIQDRKITCLDWTRKDASWQLQVWRLHSGTASMVKCLGHNASQQSILVIAETSEKTWLIEGSQASTKPIKPGVTLHVTTAGAAPLPLRCARVTRAALHLGRSICSGKTVQHVSNGSDFAVSCKPNAHVPDLSSKTQVLIRGEAKRKKKSKNSTTNEINKVVSEPAKDVHILEMVLRQPGRGVAARTAAQLPPAVLPALLEQLAVGRLDLTLAQRVARDSAVEQEAVIDYNDTSDEEMEVERQSTASDASWDDDRFDGDSEEGGDSDSGGEP